MKKTFLVLACIVTSSFSYGFLGTNMEMAETGYDYFINKKNNTIQVAPGNRRIIVNLQNSQN
jgi:hypothetical protein